jgi:hemolysin III
MGWIFMFIISPLSKTIGAKGISWLLIGGIFYTIGAVIYATKPKFLQFKYVGFHEIFHVFILLGSLSHFLCVFKYVI